MSLEDRVGSLERETARHGEQLHQVRTELRAVGDGVSRLLERDSKKPSPMTPGSIAAACGGIAATGYVIWWLIGSSPAVQELDRRLTKLDDVEVGRVTRLEQDLGRWTPRVTRAK